MKLNVEELSTLVDPQAWMTEHDCTRAGVLSMHEKRQAANVVARRIHDALVGDEGSDDLPLHVRCEPGEREAGAEVEGVERTDVQLVDAFNAAGGLPLSEAVTVMALVNAERRRRSLARTAPLSLDDLDRIEKELAIACRGIGRQEVAGWTRDYAPKLMAIARAVAGDRSKPLHTYPEDRKELLRLARLLQTPGTDTVTSARAADKLSDLVRAILEDEGGATC